MSVYAYMSAPATEPSFYVNERNESGPFAVIHLDQHRHNRITADTPAELRSLAALFTEAADALAAARGGES